MVLRIVNNGNALPIQWPVDPSAEFQPGMVGQLGMLGNQIVCGVSDGSAPIGIIDDYRTNAFSAPSIDEIVLVYVPPQARTIIGGKSCVSIDFPKNLENPNVMLSSFTTNVDVELIPRNGIIVFPAGTPLNFDQDGDGEMDSLRAVVSYTYQVPNVPGDDSTAGSGRVTIWFTRMIGQTDQYETNQRYMVGANLFVSECGLFTTRQINPKYPGIGIVTGPPTSIFGLLEFMTL
jgi:hypothetical protein